MNSKYYYYAGFSLVGLLGYFVYKQRSDAQKKKKLISDYNRIKNSPEIKNSKPKSDLEIKKSLKEKEDSYKKEEDSSYKPSYNPIQTKDYKEDKMVTSKFTQIDQNNVEWIKTLSSPLYGEKTYFWTAMTDGYVPLGGKFESLNGSAGISDKAIREMRIAIENRSKQIPDEITLAKYKKDYGEEGDSPDEIYDYKNLYGE